MAKSTLSQNSETKKWPQIVAALIATLGSFSLGCGIGWASPTLPNIDPELCDDECDITDVPEVLVPWIGSLYLLGGVIAGPLAFSILDRIGRKKTMMGLSLPMLLGYGMITASYYLNNITVLLIGRFLAGISGCAYALVAPMFISEMSEPSIRGGLATMMQLMASVGVLFVGILNINSAVHWNFISAILIGVPVIMTISLLFVPDSPKYLVMKNQIEDARKALQWFRGTTKTVVDVELEQMVEAYQREKEIGSISLKQLLTERIYLQPFILASFIMFGQQFCGVNFILFNAETIFTQAGSSVDPTLAACYIALSQFLATFASALIVDKLGRRILLIGSDLFMAVSMAAMGTYSYMDENKGNSCENSTATILQSMETLNDPSFQWKDLLHLLLRIENECDDSEGGKFDPEMVADLGWLPITSLISFMVVFSLGFGPLAWTFNAEIHPPESTRLCASISFSFNWFCAFILVLITPNLKNVLNSSGLYFLFAAICFIGIFIIYFFVPETKGKTQEEMKAYFQQKSQKNSTTTKYGTV